MTRLNRRAWLAIATVVILIGVAFAVNRATTTKAVASSPQRASLIAAANLPDCPTTHAGSGVAGGLAALTLPCLGNGPSVDLAKLRGPLVVNIWAGTCAPCKAEAPLIQQFAAAAAGKVAVLGVVDGAYTGESWDDALDASRGLGLHYPSVYDTLGKLPQRVRADGIPISLLVAADGRVTYTQIGPVKAGQLSQLVRTHLGVSVPG